MKTVTMHAINQKSYPNLTKTCSNPRLLLLQMRFGTPKLATALLLLLSLLLMREDATAKKVIRREEDFFTIELSYELHPIRKACLAVQRSEEKMGSLGLIRPPNQLNLNKIVRTQLKQCTTSLLLFTRLTSTDQTTPCLLTHQSTTIFLSIIVIKSGTL